MSEKNFASAGDMETLVTEIASKYEKKANVHSIPSGGTTGQVLTKSGGTDYAVGWTTLKNSRVVELSETNIHTEVGTAKTVTVKYRVVGISDTATYTSSDTSVATVAATGHSSTGTSATDVITITPVANGDCTIKIAFANEVGYDAEYDYINVTVGAASGGTPVPETIITVGTGGDYTDLKSALDSITDNSASKPYKIRIMAGTYSLSSGYAFGLKNHVRIVGDNKFECIVQNIHSTTVYDANYNTFDAGIYEEDIDYASIENLTIISQGCKSPIHLDTAHQKGLIEVKNCILFDNNTMGMTNIPVLSGNRNAGGCACGLSGGASIKVYDTISNGTIYAHNRTSQNAPCLFEVHNSIFQCTIWGDQGSGQPDVAIYEGNTFEDFYFGCSDNLTHTDVKTVMRNNNVSTITSVGPTGTSGQMFAGWDQVYGGKCGVVDGNIHVEVFNASGSAISRGSLVQLEAVRGVDLNGIHVVPYVDGMLFGYAMENIPDGGFGIVQYRGNVEIPQITGIAVGDEIEYNNGVFSKKTTGKTVGKYVGAGPYTRFKMELIPDAEIDNEIPSISLMTAVTPEPTRFAYVEGGFCVKGDRCYVDLVLRLKFSMSASTWPTSEAPYYGSGASTFPTPKNGYAVPLDCSVMKKNGNSYAGASYGLARIVHGGANNNSLDLSVSHSWESTDNIYFHVLGNYEIES